jgi:hypothetical protein
VNPDENASVEGGRQSRGDMSAEQMPGCTRSARAGSIALVAAGKRPAPVSD